mmetsp:Transcript_41592/g.96427  ORF Transcript_41592/g.96427 Transcript_41592/m.96427 type:complete len:283 (-) Transcript_41592:148-996(-)
MDTDVCAEPKRERDGDLVRAQVGAARGRRGEPPGKRVTQPGRASVCRGGRAAEARTCELVREDAGAYIACADCVDCVHSRHGELPLAQLPVGSHRVERCWSVSVGHSEHAAVRAVNRARAARRACVCSARLPQTAELGHIAERAEQPARGLVGRCVSALLACRRGLCTRWPARTASPCELEQLSPVDFENVDATGCEQRVDPLVPVQHDERRAKCSMGARGRRSLARDENREQPAIEVLGARRGSARDNERRVRAERVGRAREKVVNHLVRHIDGRLDHLRG